MKKILFIVLSVSNILMAFSESDLEKVMDAKELQLNAIRKEEIGSLERIVSRRTSVNKQPEILMRLIELYGSAHAFYKIKENEFAQKFNRKYNYDISNSYIKKGIQSGESLLKSKRSFKRLDKVHYYLALFYDANKQSTKSRAHWTQLVNRYPSSEFAIEGHIALGSHAYDKKNFRLAKKHYLEASKFKQSSSYLRVLHRLGWIEFRLGNPRGAIRIMKRIVDISNESNENKFIGYKENALQDLVIFYGETNQHEEAKSYFRQYGTNEQYVSLIEMLSARFQKQGRYREAIAINREIIEQTEDLDKRLDLLIKNIRLQKRLNQYRALLEESKYLLTHFGPKSAWGQGKAKSEYTPEARQKRIQEIESEIRSIATQFHSTAKKSESKSLFVPARELYELYLQSFENSKYTDEMRLYYADALLNTDRFERASGELKKIYSDPKIDKKIRQEALTTLLDHSAEQMQRVKKEKDKRLSNEEKIYIETAKDYEQYFNDQDSSSKVKFSISNLFLNRGMLDQAFDNNEEIIKKYPRTASAKAAVKMNLDIKNQQKDYAGIQALSDKYIKSGALSGDEKLQKEISNLSRDVSFLQAEQLAKDKKYDQAGKAFESLHTSLADPEKKYAALLNSYVNYSKTNDSVSTKRVGSMLISRYPNKPEAKQIKVDLAEDFVYRLEPADALSLYKQIYKSEKDPQTVKKLTLALAVFSKALNHPRDANSYYDLYIRKYNSDSLIDEVYLEKFDLNQDNRSELIKDLREYSSRNRKKYPSELYYKLSEIDSRRRSEFWNMTVNSFNSGSKSYAERFYAARAKYNLVALDYFKFADIKFQLPAANLMNAIKNKLALMDNLTKGYASVVTIGSPHWTVAALDASGSVFRSMSESYSSIPTPPEYKGDIKAQFEKSLKDKSDEFEKQAKVLLEEGRDKAAEFDVASKSVESIYEKLNKIDSKQFPLPLSPIRNMKMRISYE